MRKQRAALASWTIFAGLTLSLNYDPEMVSYKPRLFIDTLGAMDLAGVEAQFQLRYLANRSMTRKILLVRYMSAPKIIS